MKDYIKTIITLLIALLFVSVGLLFLFMFCETPKNNPPPIASTTPKPIVVPETPPTADFQAGTVCTSSAQCAGHLFCTKNHCGNANSMPVNVFKATLPTEKTEFVMSGKLSDYYNYEFGDIDMPNVKNIYYSVKLCDADELWTCLNGYIKKQDARQMFSLLKDGKYHLLRVVIAYPASKQDSGIAHMYSATPMDVDWKNQ